MQAAFGTVIWIVCVVALVIGVVLLATSGRTWSEFGKNALLMDSEAARDHRHSSPTAQLERDEEIRQLLEARNLRRRRRGQEPIDVETELARLTAPKIDAELRDEIRQLVLARNHRRARTGKPPLDVEAEIEREIVKLQQL